MNYLYMDCEFNRKDFTKRGLVSIGMCTKDASYYAVNADMDLQGIVEDPEIGAWMTEHIFEPHIPTSSVRHLSYSNPDVKQYSTIATEVDQFIKAACTESGTKGDIEVIANCGAQDMVRLHTLLGNNDWGKFGCWVPTHFDDIARIKRVAYSKGMTRTEIPEQPEHEQHHALYDAQYEMTVHQYIRTRFGDI